jgi:hypothetical protein
VFAIAIGLWLLNDSFLPRVEDPWPETVGLDLPFMLSGASAALAAIVYFEAPSAKRSRAVRKSSLIGFCIGALIYVISLVNTVGFPL